MKTKFWVGFGMVCLAAGLAGLADPAGAAPAPSPPNVLVIVADDMGFSDLGCYGGEVQTPNLDKLAQGGLRFTQFYNTARCWPSRASILTGYYPQQVRRDAMPGLKGGISGRRPAWARLLPELLQPLGYRSYHSGKWHLDGKVLAGGFNHSYSLNDHDRYFNPKSHTLDDKPLPAVKPDSGYYATTAIAQYAIDMLAEHQTHYRSQPFFLYLAYNAPHVPIQPPQEWLDCVKQRESGIDEKRAKLVALIEHLDAGIGKVIDTLKETGLYDNTLVIFTSDNGGQLSAGATNGPLRASKGDMYEGGIREPMCAVWPGRIRAGSRSDCVALTMDVFPTACAAAGVPLEHEIDGRSILPTLMGKAQPQEERTLFWVRREGGSQYGGRAYYASRQGDFKLLQNSPFEPMELYNLKDDPQEQKPLGRKHPMYSKLFTALQGHVTQAGAVPWQKYPVDLKQPTT